MKLKDLDKKTKLEHVKLKIPDKTIVESGRVSSPTTEAWYVDHMKTMIGVYLSTEPPSIPKRMTRILIFLDSREDIMDWEVVEVFKPIEINEHGDDDWASPELREQINTIIQENSNL